MSEWEKVKVQALMYIDLCSGEPECEVILSLITESEKEIAELKSQKHKAIFAKDKLICEVSDLKATIKKLAEHSRVSG